MFEEDSDVDASLWWFTASSTDWQALTTCAGTSWYLLWGAPVALAFGLVAAVGSSIATMTLAAASRVVWRMGRLADPED